MLHKETVAGATFELLKEMMQDPALADFNLAGGTALALYMGHRKSVDLDLFTPHSFDTDYLENHMHGKYNLRTTFKRGFTLKGYIGDVAIDCIKYDYPLLSPVVVSPEGIRLYSPQDIAAMKLSAIADNGSRLKDFIDVAYLSTVLSLSDMLKAYETQFTNSTRIRALKGLAYHDDIDFDEPIMLIKGAYDWDSIAKRLTNMMDNDEKIYRTFPTKPMRRIAPISPKKKFPKQKL